MLSAGLTFWAVFSCIIINYFSPQSNIDEQIYYALCLMKKIIPVALQAHDYSRSFAGTNTIFPKNRMQK
jgi:hypothetical protein